MPLAPPRVGTGASRGDPGRAETTLRLWDQDGIDVDELAAETRLALSVSEEIKALDKRIAALYRHVDPDAIVASAPGVGVVGAPQIAGRLGDATRFASLAAVRSFAGLVPHQDASGVAARDGGPTKPGDAGRRPAHPHRCVSASRDPLPAARHRRHGHSEQQGRAVIAQRYTIPPKIQAFRRRLGANTRQPRTNERAKKGVATRSEAPPVPQPA